LDLIVRNVLLGISVAAPIGPASLAIIQAGVAAGFGRAFTTAVGVVLADASYLLVVFFGMATLVDRSAVRIGLWFGGAAILIYMGLRSLTGMTSGVTLTEDQHSLGTSPLLVGFAVNITNPLAVVWWLGIFGSLLAEGTVSSSTWQSLALASSTLFGILLWHTAISLFSHGGRRWLDGRLLRLVTGAAGLALIGFGLRFAGLAIQAVARQLVG
jgi:L-lysine exporter family protein LysE/ArgO